MHFSSDGVPCRYLKHVLVGTVVLAASACGPDFGRHPLDPAFAPGGGGPPVKVTATDPTEAEQGTTLSVRVLGSNFEPGAVAEFRLDGVPPGQVRTNSTTFISETELHAEIAIDADAELGFYDVEVSTPRGKKGVGTELFRVKLQGGGAPTDYVITNFEGAVWSAGPIGAAIEPNGGFNFDAGGKGRNANPELCLDLSTLGPEGIVDASTYDTFVQQVLADPTSSGMQSACTEAAVHTRDHSNGGLDIPVGAIEHAGGKFVLKDFRTARDTWEWRLHWDVEGPLMHLPERGRGICIQKAASAIWHVYNDDELAVDPPSGCQAAGEQVDNVMRLTRWSGTTMILVATFRVPFRFSFVPQP